MKRVVITGMGIWSCIGQDLQTVTESLKQGRSGIIFDPARIEYGMQSGLVGNVPKPDLKPYISRKARMMMSEDAEYAYMAARQAFEQAGIDEAYLQNNEVGIIWGNEGNAHQIEYNKIMEEEHSSTLIGYNAMFRSLTSSAAINLASIFHLKGIKFNLSAGCASAAHAIGVATTFIRQGIQDVILVGGSQSINMKDINGLVVDSLTSFPDEYTKTPTKACRPFDQKASGGVMSGGASGLVIEEYEHAIQRGVPILAEIIGYGFSSGTQEEIYLPDADAEKRAIDHALLESNFSIKDIDCICSHANTNIISDSVEAKMLSGLLSGFPIPIVAVESITGHEGGMSGASGMVYSILMLKNSFLTPNINLENPIDEAHTLNIVTQIISNYSINTVLVNSIGIGSSYSSIIIKKI